MELLRKFWARSWSDKVLLLRALGLVGGVRVGLNVLPYRTVQRLLTRSDYPTTEAFDSPAEALKYRRRVIGAVQTIGKRLLGDKPCLTQALVVQHLLRTKGYETALRIGVTKEGRELLAHAWLERDCQVIIGGGTSAQYVPLVPVEPEVA